MIGVYCAVGLVTAIAACIIWAHLSVSRDEKLRKMLKDNGSHSSSPS